MVPPVNRRARALLVAGMALLLAGAAGGVPDGAIASPTVGPTYYVSVSGSDANAGTIDAPWRTLRHALTQLTPGSTLYLRSGTYFESKIPVSARGTSTAPITISSYPGDNAVIDGGVPGFARAPNSNWQLVDSSTGLYRSVRTFPAASSWGAWLLDDDIQLVQYSSFANLSSTYYGPEKPGTPEYIGPGIERQDDGHLYIRLTANPNDLSDAGGETIAPTPADTNPNDHPMSIFRSDSVVKFDDARFLSFQNLRFQGSVRIFDGRAKDITVGHCTMLFGTYGIVVRSGAANWSFTDDEWDNGFPGWLYWTDVKDTDGIDEAYPEFQSEAISDDGPVRGFVMTGNTFRDSFDGVHLSNGSQNDLIAHNFFVRIHDDGMEISEGAGGKVEIAHNMFWHVASGISTGDSSPMVPAGPVYIHHNVIDDSALQRGGRPGNRESSNWVPWMTLDPSSTHGPSLRGWWDFYNNTIVTRRSTAYHWNGAAPAIAPSRHKLVYNNIWYTLDARIIFRDDSIESGAQYDGDVFWRESASPTTRYKLLYQFGNGRSYRSLTAFRSAGLNWERRGLQVDPGFDPTLLNDPTFDASTIWSRYEPTNPEVFTLGASYASLGWPGTSQTTYRGALPSAGGARGCGSWPRVAAGR